MDDVWENCRVQYAKENREKVLKEFQKESLRGILWLVGEKSKCRHDTDVDLALRQESNYFYVSGIDDMADTAILIEIQSGKCILFISQPSVDHDIWMGPKDSLELTKKKYGLDDIFYSHQIQEKIKEINTDKIYTLTNEGNFLGLETDTIYLKKVLTNARMIKSSLEINLICKACEISSSAHVKLMIAAKTAKFERDLERTFVDECMKHYCRFQSYLPIVGAGMNAAILHYGNNNTAIMPTDLILVDAGTEYNCYASDITRVFPANGKFSIEQTRIYEIVLNAQKLAISMVKPNVEYIDVHMAATRAIADGLRRIGILKGNLDELCLKHVPAIFFPHGIGHLMGLDVHDVGGYPEGKERINAPGLRFLRLNRSLQIGMVLTIEPGIYFIDALLNSAKVDKLLSQFIDFDIVQRYYSVGGVRIEDNVLVTPTGHDVLTTAPKEISEIELLMK